MSTVALAGWLGIQLMAPQVEVAPAMQTKPSAKFQMNQSAEARLLGVETTGGLTPPSVRLIGVFASDQRTGAAVLSVEGRPAKSFAVGENVANGWTLAEVTGTEAVISRSGQRHRVTLPRTTVDSNLMRRVQ
ncbi:MAG: type II secretion system protein N [Limnobacter sp.]|nr:type II secretion system protein N [Limnobacter sp.]